MGFYLFSLVNFYFTENIGIQWQCELNLLTKSDDMVKYQGSKAVSMSRMLDCDQIWDPSNII